MTNIIIGDVATGVISVILGNVEHALIHNKLTTVKDAPFIFILTI